MNNFFRKHSGVFTGILIELLLAAALCAESYANPFEEGAHLFKTNRPEEAIPVLELALTRKDVDPVAYIYLAMSYDQTGRREEAIDLLKKAMLVPDADRKTIAFNIGNLFFLDENYLDAQQWYSTAIEEDEEFYPPVLNRANALLRQDKIEDCIDDYEHFITACPEDPQVPTIIQLLALLHEELAAREAAKADAELAAEEAILAAMREQERLAMERALQEQMQKEMSDKLAAEDAALLNAMVGEESGTLAPQDTAVVYEKLDDTADMGRSESVADANAALRGFESVGDDLDAPQALVEAQPTYESVGGDDIDLPRQIASVPAAQYESIGSDIDAPQPMPQAPRPSYESVQSEELPQLTVAAPAPRYERIDSAAEAAEIAAANAQSATAPRTAADATRGMEQVGTTSVDTLDSLDGFRAGAASSYVQKVDSIDTFSEDIPVAIPQEKIANTEAEQLNAQYKKAVVPSTKVGESDYEQAQTDSEKKQDEHLEKVNGVDQLSD